MKCVQCFSCPMSHGTYFTFSFAAHEHGAGAEGVLLGLGLTFAERLCPLILGKSVPGIGKDAEAGAAAEPHLEFDASNGASATATTCFGLPVLAGPVVATVSDPTAQRVLPAVGVL